MFQNLQRRSVRKTSATNTIGVSESSCDGLVRFHIGLTRHERPESRAVRLLLSRIRSLWRAGLLGRSGHIRSRHEFMRRVAQSGPAWNWRKSTESGRLNRGTRHAYSEHYPNRAPRSSSHAGMSPRLTDDAAPLSAPLSTPDAPASTLRSAPPTAAGQRRATTLLDPAEPRRRAGCR